MKICSICKVSLDLSLFKPGFKRCEPCLKIQRSERYLKNKLNPEFVEKKKRRADVYRKENRDDIRKRYKAKDVVYKEKKKIYYENNKEEIKQKSREYLKKNKAKSNANRAKKKAVKLQATPPWLTKEHLKEIEQFYIRSKEMQKETGIKYHVDHIIPLQGKTVCGLHVPWNLQILEASENIKKGNRLYE